MDFPQFDEIFPAWNKGYWAGYALEDKANPYEKGTRDWDLYEAGYEEGWLDS